MPNRWWYAADARTLALFRPLAALVRAPLDALPPRGAGRGPPTLTSACFIVVASAVAPAASLWHLDWGACARRGAAFTALTPLSGPQMTSERCAAHGLEYEPWDAAPGDLARLYAYARGDAVIFDGRLPHRTAPFTQSFRTTNNITDRCVVEGEIAVEPAGPPGVCRVRARGECVVTLRGFGPKIEQIIVDLSLIHI